MEPELTNGLSDDELADLARLADGTLPAERLAEVEARVAASPQLSSIVARQRFALNALHGAADESAPARLHARVSRRREPRTVGGRRRVVMGGALAAAASAAIALILVLPGALSDNPSISDAAALADKPPSQGAPAIDSSVPQQLRAEVDEVPFPNYTAKFGWKPTGTRQDDPSGRSATTVYYGKGDREIAYTIVSGDALDPPSDARSTTRGGVEYRTFRYDGRTAVTWERDGNTCVLSGSEVRPAELLALADWRGKGAISF
jgi:anti-sigma factor RsiW